MKQKTRTSYLIVPVIVLLLFALAACVRPVPQPDQPETTPVPTLAPTVEFATAVPPAPTAETGYPGADGGQTDPTQPDPNQPDPNQPDPNQPDPNQPAPSQPTSHTVQQGETLNSIAQQYGVSPDEIAAANNLTNANELTTGQVLVIPAPGSVVVDQSGGGVPEATAAPSGQQVHVVQPGENLFRISLRYGKTVDEVAAYNGIANPHFIYPGQVILIP